MEFYHAFIDICASFRVHDRYLTDKLVLAPVINGTLNMDNIRGESAAAYAEHTRNHSDFMRKKNAEVLNKHDRAL